MIQSRTTIFVLLFTLVLSPAIGRTATLPQAPSIDPPQVTGEPQAGVVYKEKTLLKEKNQTEWSYHKSADGHLVTDADTGLSWQDYQITVKEEAPGIAYCNDLSMDGYTDWRFPSFSELQNFFKGVAADTTFDLNHWGSFSGCTASIADGGHVKTPVGAQQHGGSTGDRINFSGHAAVHCVR